MYVVNGETIFDTFYFVKWLINLLWLKWLVKKVHLLIVFNLTLVLSLPGLFLLSWQQVKYGTCTSNTSTWSHIILVCILLCSLNIRISYLRLIMICWRIYFLHIIASEFCVSHSSWHWNILFQRFVVYLCSILRLRESRGCYNMECDYPHKWSMCTCVYDVHV